MGFHSGDLLEFSGQGSDSRIRPESTREVTTRGGAEASMCRTARRADLA